jgi:phosphoglycerol transferase
MTASAQAPGLPSPATGPGGGAAGRSERRVIATELGYAAIAGLLALAIALWALKVWNANLSVPFRYSEVDDTKFYLLLIKGILAHGWFLTNHNLGAPFGQQLYDYPQGADNLNLFTLKLIGLVSPHPGVVINVFLFVTFVLDGAAACLVLRRLNVSPLVSIVCAVLFALLPYHFFRSDSHLFLSSYWSLPFTAYLFIAVLDDRPLFTAQPSGGRVRRVLTPATVATVLMCLVIASTGLYYAVFGLVMIAAALLLKLLSQRRLRALLPGLAAFALVLVVLIANLAPTAVYHAQHGGNSAEVHSASQGDSLAMSASYLVLPPLHDRIAPLRHLTEHYANVTPPHGYCEQCYESVGTTGDVGLVWLLVVALGGLTGAAFVTRVSRLYRWSALGVAVVLAIAITGGVSSLTRVFVSNDIRAWNRMSVLIAFFALLTVGLLLDRLLPWIRARGARHRRLARLGPWPGLLLVVAVLAFGVADQTSRFFVPNFARDATEYHSDAALDTTLERTLPHGADVMEFPYVPYPEGYQPYMSPGQTLPFSEVTNFEYELGRPYIQSHGLSFSYGAMKGRATNWAAQLAAKPLAVSVIGVTAAGFPGLTVDVDGYPGAQPAVVATLRRLLGVAPRYSADHTFLFYDLRPYARRLRARHTAAQLSALRAATLYPLRLSCSTGRLTIVNPSQTTQRAVLDAGVTGDGGAAALRLTAGGRPLVSGRGARLKVPLVLAPGTTTVSLSGASDDASGTARLTAPTVIAGAFAPFLRGVSGGPLTGIVGPPCRSVSVG